ncbi:MAG: integrase domain-containing protein [Candidatus Thiodiazotropha sp. (ex Lucinoma kastoroae)]|nr:integrase domain-containing protein [Candidatus Thiodiazotropha sp. (ex Lucinoma kastoroae)]
MKEQGINDARKITLTVLNRYNQFLKDLVNTGKVSVAYAQNRLSTVNVVLETMRKDTVLTIKPAQIIGQRSHVRSTVPATFRTDVLKTITVKNGQNRTMLIAQLTRDLGLRFKEASLLDTRKALRQVRQHRRINIIQGTKGGRGKGSDRWIPVSNQCLQTLKSAALIQGKEQNLIPPDSSYKQWRVHRYNQWCAMTKQTAINGFHDMRAAYACERYQTITGYPAPVITGKRQADKALDKKARTIPAQELGHNRTDVVAAYIGSSR